MVPFLVQMLLSGSDTGSDVMDTESGPFRDAWARVIVELVSCRRQAAEHVWHEDRSLPFVSRTAALQSIGVGGRTGC